MSKIFNPLVKKGLDEVGSGGGGTAAWGNITGTLSNQSDLQAALDLKADLTDLNAYLKLDGSNDPITGGITISPPTGQAALTINQALGDAAYGLRIVVPSGAPDNPFRIEDSTGAVRFRFDQNFHFILKSGIADSTEVFHVKSGGDTLIAGYLRVGSNQPPVNTTSGDFSSIRGFFSGPVEVADEAYSTSWNGSIQVPTKNAVYDKIQSLNLDALSDVVISSPAINQVLTYNGSEWVNADPLTDIDATAVSFTVSQTGHGFVAGDVVKNSGSANTYAKAQADSAANAEVVGIVTEVINANSFVLTTEGIVTEGVPAQAAGSVMFLSASTAGALTTTEPSTLGEVSKPLAVVLESGARMLFHNFRGQTLSSEGGGGGGGSPLAVQDVDGTPLVNNVTTIRVTNGTLTDEGSGVVTIDTGGSGDVTGPASATTNAISTFADTSGKLLQESPVAIDGSGNLTGVGTIASGAITSTGASSFGSLSLTTDLPVTEGGTGSSTALGARSNLLAQDKIFYTVGPTASDDYVTDGTADEVQINQAITDANSAGGGTVFLKPGIYTIAAAVSLLSNVWLLGSGMTTTIIKKVASASSIAGIQVISRTNFYIADLKIDGNRPNGATGRGLNIATSSNGLVERVYLIDAVEGFKTQSCTDIKFRDCIADGNYEWNYYQYDGTRIKVHFCQSLNAKAGTFEGFGMAFYHNNTDCEAIGNYIYNPAHNGIQVNSGSATADVVGVVIRDNEVVNAGHRGIQLTEDGNTFHVKKASIVNNRVTGSVNKGIYLNKVEDSVVMGNKSYSNTSEDGICYDTCTNLYSSGNYSSGNATGLRTISSTKVIVSDFITGNTTNYSLDTNVMRLGPEDILIDGDSARTIGSKRITTAASTGVNLTVQAGGATSGGTDLNGGTLVLASGIATGNNSSRVEFQVVPNGQGAGTTDRSPLTVMYLSATGTNNTRVRVGIGTNGVGAVDGISFSGNSAYQVAMNRHTTNNTAGNNFTIQSGGTKGGGVSTDKGAGDLILATGISTGTGTSRILLKTADVGTSGTTDNTLNTRVQIDNTGMQITGALTISTPLAIVQGGTGATTLSGVLKGNGTSAVTGSATLNDLGVPTSSFSMNSQRITSLADPTSNQDAATKAYVDSVAQGLDAKDSCRVATTGNITLSGEQTIDGVAVVTGDRVLVKNQSTASQNGIYVCDSGAWSRAADADTSPEVSSGMFTFITAGTVNANTGWVLTTTGTITLGTTALTFSQFSAATTLTAGDGMVQSGSAFNVVGTSNRISVSADAIDISSSYVGQSSITTLGTITTGVWNGTDIAVADGGTGASTASGARTNLGLGTIATQDASNVSITGGAITGITDLAVADGGTGASDASGARTNLGLGSIATQASSNVTITGGSISGITDLALADGGTGASTASSARGNLGLGTIATQDASTVSITGGSVTGITDLAIADGGTGASSANAALNNLLPSQTGNSGKYLTSDGTNASWATVTGGSGYRTLVTLGSDVASTNSISFQNITGLSFSVTAGNTYRFYGLLAYTASSITIGLRVSVQAPSTSFLAYTTRSPLNTNGSASNLWVNGKAGLDEGTASSSSAQSAGTILVIEGMVTVTASGTLQLRFAPETATTNGIIIKAGSTLEYW